MDLTDRLALVTGASRGLGRAVAEQLGARGAQVVAVARTVGGLEEVDEAIQAAGGPGAVLVPLDITDGDGVDRLGAALFERFGRLDHLVHAAAEGPSLTPVSHLRPKDIERQFAVNAVAAARLIRSLAPLLAISADQERRPSALYATDEKAALANWGAYGAAKAAAASMFSAYAAETKKVRVVLHQPPAMPTALRARTHPGENRATLTPVAAAAAALTEALLAEA